MKTRGQHMYYVCKLSIGLILNSKKREKLIIFKKRNEYIYFEILPNVPFTERTEMGKNLDNSNIMLNAYSELRAIFNYSKSNPLYCHLPYYLLRTETYFNMSDINL